MAYQFIHMESYSRKGDAKGRTTAFVLAEARRDPASSVHVPKPAAPVVVFGAHLDEVQAIHDAAADAARTTPKGGKPRKIRVDQQTLLTVVASHPFTVEEVRTDNKKRREVGEWERRTVVWLQQQYGAALVSVVRHEDESYWHIHAYVLPPSPDMRASALHPGQVAKAEIMAAGPSENEDAKALNRRGDAAYRVAMREWQNSYFDSVAVKCGLTRLGPARRRLSRAEWQAEKTQAIALRKSLELAKEVRSRGQSFIATTKEAAEQMKADAAAAQAAAAQQMEAARAATIAALAAQDKAIAEQKKAQGMMVRVRAELERVRNASAKIQRLPGLLRTFWDGLRKSRIRDQIEKSVASEIENLHVLASSAAERVAAADAARRRAEEKSRSLDKALAETGIQRDTAWRELARLRPREPEINFRSAPRPKRSGQ